MAPQRLSRSNTDGAHSTSQNALLLSMFDTLTYNSICRCRKLEITKRFNRNNNYKIYTTYRTRNYKTTKPEITQKITKNNRNRSQNPKKQDVD